MFLFCFGARISLSPSGKHLSWNYKRRWFELAPADGVLRWFTARGDARAHGAVRLVDVAAVQVRARCRLALR